MEILIGVIAITATFTIFFGGLTIGSAWEFGGEFYIDEFKGRRKMWIERLLDGFEIIKKF